MLESRPSQNAREWLGKLLIMDVDRPLGSRHPNHPSIRYSLNYGYIPNTLAADGKELDAYLVGVHEPVVRFQGRCVAIIHRRNDVEDKLVIAPHDQTFTNEEIVRLTDFQERFFESVLIR